MDITGRHPAESFAPAKCRLHRFSGLHRFCSFFYRTPIQTLSKICFHVKQTRVTESLSETQTRGTSRNKYSGTAPLGQKQVQALRTNVPLGHWTTLIRTATIVQLQW